MDKLLRIELKVTQENNDYSFFMPYGANAQEAVDACVACINEIKVMAEEQEKLQKEQEAAAAEGEGDGSK